jgi:pyruvate dehydrogenase E1 component alpha subunit
MSEITKDFLIDFEKEIHDIYARGEISGPVHLSCGNEDQLIDIFKIVKEDDWVFSTWRSHYHALLKSNDPEWVKREILEGRSIHLNSEKYRIFTSAIVGGILPIALGVALANKRAGKLPAEERVWCFVGDMTATLGIFIECTKYAVGFDLPITFVVENNGLSCYTPTDSTWGEFSTEKANRIILEYSYKREPYPHHGIGQWVEFQEKKHWGPAF